ncbi:MAG: hypothetical protein KC503_13090 [Myxococcales bacterium]|nr:hypothetical protein [Myxococcales bacterium]
MRSSKLVTLACLALLIGTLAACGDSTGNGTGDGGVGDGQADAPGDGGGNLVDGRVDTPWITDDAGVVRIGDGTVVLVNDAGERTFCYITYCADKLLACGDCIDNDGDGLVDWQDPECLGPCMNNEGPSLLGGVGGNVSNNCNVDCYFDFGDGAGNDDCKWNHRCDPLAPRAQTCAYDKAYTDSQQGQRDCPAQQSAKCEKQCLPYTPNGCDCFGCCTFPQLAGKGPNGGEGYVFIGATTTSGGKKVGTCTYNDINDTTKCPPCTPVKACLNPCGRCEICIGKPTVPADCHSNDAGAPVPLDASLPDSAAPDAGTPTAQCPGGEQPCGQPGQAICPQGTYCITGCCIRIVIN